MSSYECARAARSIAIAMLAATSVGCMQRVSGLSLQSLSRYGWCAEGPLRLDSQDLGPLLHRRCISAPFVPVALYCDPSKGLGGTLAIRSLTDHQLRVEVRVLRLAQPGARTSMDFAPSPRLQGAFEIQPRDAELFESILPIEDIPMSARLVIEGSYEVSNGDHGSFNCDVELKKIDDPWSWYNPLVSSD